MSNEKRSDSFHWKNELDKLDHLPGENQIDKAQAWDKLYKRLRTRRQRRAVPLFWMAAAVLALAFGLTWMFKGRETRDLTNVNEPSIKLLRPDGPEIMQPNDSSSGNTPRIQQTAIAAPVAKVKIRQEDKNRQPHLPETGTGIDSTVQQAPDVITHIIRVPDTGVVAVVTPVKKKLRIIHINDLDKSLPQIEYAQTPSSIPVTSRLSRHDGVSAFMLSRNASDNIVKIKLSPSN